MKKIVILSLAGIILGINAYAQCPRDRGVTASAPSETELENLKFLREEEFLAHDVYQYLGDLYDLRVFQNITKSEAHHTSRVKMLIDRYGVEDPADNHKTGIFENKELQSLYDELIEKGKMSVDSAIIVGLMVEEKDIQDLTDALDNIVTAEDIRIVYTNLRRASGNHLRAFNRNAEFYNLEYRPRILCEAKFWSIIEDY